jgi:hypothetical protein
LEQPDKFMVSYQFIARAAASPWSWLWQAWRLRKSVLALASDFAKSPTHTELAELRSARDVAQSAAFAAEDALARKREESDQAEIKHQAEVARLKAKYDQRVHASGNGHVEALKVELTNERDAVRKLKLDLEDVRAKMAEQEKEFQVSRDGNRALLRFIHTRHRLVMKFDPHSIRGALQAADQKK